MLYSRRDIGKLALASVPLSAAFGAKINSKIDGVELGAISYSFNTLASPDPMKIVQAYTAIGLGECELMSNHCEALAGAPEMPAFGRGGFGGGAGAGGARRGATGAPGQMAGGAPGQMAAGTAGRGQGRGGGRAPLTPEQQAERDAATKKVADWKAATTPATWKAVTKKFNDAGVTVALLCYNMSDNMKDEDIEYGFKMAEGLGVKFMSTSTTLTMGKRIAPIAEAHKIMVGFHGHDSLDPNQTSTPASFATLISYGKYNGINLDIGHFTAAGYDAVDFITKNHAKITNLHIKDRKRNVVTDGRITQRGAGVFPWGTGDTPIKAVLQLCKKNKYPFPANMELEEMPRDQDVVELAKQCFAYEKSCLA